VKGQGLENRVIRYDQASAPRSTEVPKQNRNGRFPGFRVILLAAPSRKTPVALCGVHRLLQLRDSEGFKPSSLLPGPAKGSAPKPCG